jgi:hypothetical protein
VGFVRLIFVLAAIRETFFFFYKNCECVVFGAGALIRRRVVRTTHQPAIQKEIKASKKWKRELVLLRSLKRRGQNKWETLNRASKARG